MAAYPFAAIPHPAAGTTTRHGLRCRARLIACGGANDA
jgi:hypothetical protein